MTNRSRFSRLLESGHGADVTFEVEGVQFPAHRSIVSFENDYFNALLNGGFRESEESIVKICDASAEAFRTVLRYFYNALKESDVERMQTDVLQNVFHLANRFGIRELERLSVYFLGRASVEPGDVAHYLSIAAECECEELKETMMYQVRQTAEQFLRNEKAIANLDVNGLKALLSDSKLRVEESTIVRMLLAWRREHTDTPDMSCITKLVHWDLVPLKVLTTEVRPSGIMSGEQLLDAIVKNAENVDKSRTYRGPSGEDDLSLFKPLSTTRFLVDDFDENDTSTAPPNNLQQVTVEPLVSMNVGNLSKSHATLVFPDVRAYRADTVRFTLSFYRPFIGSCAVGKPAVLPCVRATVLVSGDGAQWTCLIARFDGRRQQSSDHEIIGLRTRLKAVQNIRYVRLEDVYIQLGPVRAALPRDQMVAADLQLLKYSTTE